MIRACAKNSLEGSRQGLGGPVRKLLPQPSLDKGVELRLD